MVQTALDTQHDLEVHELFRGVNERLRHLDGGDVITPRLILVCECADLRCILMIELKRDEYAGVRRHPGRFVVAAGREHAAASEWIVEEHERYTVVGTLPAGTPVADAATAA